MASGAAGRKDIMAKDVKKPPRTGWDDIILVCAKCERKLKGGYGPAGKKDLSKVLSRALDDGGARIGVVETLCLDVCPRGGVTTVLASRPGQFTVIPAETPIDEIMNTLGLDLPHTG